MRALFNGLFISLVLVACDGTLTGIGRVPLPPETPLPPAPVETASPGGSEDAPGAPSSSEGAEGVSEEIAARHLLVMYKGSRSAPPSIVRSREEAQARAFEALRQAKAGKDFGKVVAEFTDEPGGAMRHGDLGRFRREVMVKAFADAAFALKPGQLSTVIETPFGFHVIQRTE